MLEQLLPQQKDAIHEQDGVFWGDELRCAQWFVRSVIIDGRAAAAIPTRSQGYEQLPQDGLIIERIKIIPFRRIVTAPVADGAGVMEAIDGSGDDRPAVGLDHAGQFGRKRRLARGVNAVDSHTQRMIAAGGADKIS